MKQRSSVRTARLGAAAAAVTALAWGLAARPAPAAAAPFAAVRPAAGAWRAHRVTAYVANFYSGTVTPIRTATNTALKPIRVVQGPYAIAITP